MCRQRAGEPQGPFASRLSLIRSAAVGRRSLTAAGPARSIVEHAGGFMTLLGIEEVGARLGVPHEALYRYGPHKAKLAAEFLAQLPPRQGKLILVTAISPTPAGEGKTTTTIGLGDALTRIGKQDDDLPARTLAGAVLRHEGRRDRRRRGAGGAGGRDQPALHRRLPRHHRRQQPAGRSDRQPHLLGQCARPRSGARHLAPRHGHERPRAAAHRPAPRPPGPRCAKRASTSPSPRR